MKTKSKRFLNLATLCLALLGTTLLMTCPVKAEVGEGSDKSKVQQKQSPYEKTPYEQGVTDGHDAGYKLGKQHRQQNGSSDASPTRPDVPEPKNNPYSTDSDRKKYKLGWDTAYPSSYYTGWYSYDHPNEEEEEDISGNLSSQSSTEQDSTEQGSTDDSFSSIIDMVVDITKTLWDLVSSWFSVD
ncbi:TPA: hypothetical protein VIS21_000470 [Streptococcus pyogenes]|uniref:hypothetical protein n=1 Tax=Streptococcus pyogenes TaxID=1314 RepID=UPI0010A1C8B0|nr:hypothetical protein [Streptococcus pyogenes]VGQ29648.1 hypothetical membrane associated protein [Streptococcus pyogenes]VGQ53635.1 hypothetical membrane associated protein [Streptococcus pyogenes]VGV25350.1 Uncharacterised protein [Streptococcus pyogenes]VGV62573.1 Uncharacterised protein [Streptococcus pyogenes]VGV91084.1 Uncharacterised protein [Streptococcus pyogenes]